MQVFECGTVCTVWMRIFGPIIPRTNRGAGHISVALPKHVTCSALLLLRSCYSHCITMELTCTGTVDPVMCKTTGQAVYQQPRAPVQKCLCFGKEIGWERGHQLAVKSVLHSPFLPGNLRMDSDEVLWQEPKLDPLGPTSEVAPPHDQHASIYTSSPTQGFLTPVDLLC